MDINQADRRRRRKNKEKKITYKLQANFLLAFGVVIVALVLLIGVLVKINLKDGDKYAKRALSQQSYTSSEIPFKRGDIVDSNNVVKSNSSFVIISPPDFHRSIAYSCRAIMDRPRAANRRPYRPDRDRSAER